MIIMNSEVKTRVKTEGVKRIKNEVVDIGSDMPNKKIKISNSISSDSSTMSSSIKCLMNSCREKSEFSNMNPFLDHCVRTHFFDELKSDLKNTARHELECPLCPDDKNTFQKLKQLIWHYGVHHEMVLKYAKFQTIKKEFKGKCEDIKNLHQEISQQKMEKEFKTKISKLKKDCEKLEKEKLLIKNKEHEEQISKQNLQKLIIEFQNEIIVLKEDCAKSELEKEKLLKKNEENEAKIYKQNIELERNYAKYELEKEKLLKQNLEYEAKISKQNIELEKYSLKHKNYAKSELEKEQLLKQNQEYEAKILNQHNELENYSSRHKNQKVDSVLEILKKTCESQKMEENKLRKKLKESENKMANLNEVIKDLKNDCARFKIEMNYLKMQEQKLELECKCYRSEIKDIRQKCKNEALEIAKQFKKRAKKIKAKAKRDIFLLEKKNDILKKLIQEFQSELSELKENSAISESEKEKLLNSNQEDHSFEFEAINRSTNDQKMIIKEEFQTEISKLKETCAKSELEKEKLLKKNQEYEAKLSKQNIELENYSSTRKKFICKKCCTDLESGYMLDCGHLPFCNSCSMSITIEESPKCPICKKSVAYRLPALIEEVI